MAAIGIRELRSALATYIRKAQSGERVTITVDGAPVAQITGLTPDLSGVTMSDLIAQGLVTPPRRRGDFVPDDPLILTSGARIDRALNQVRT